MNKPYYCDYIDDDYINAIKQLLKSPSKATHINNIIYGDLNPSIDYNQILSNILSNIDNAIDCIIESKKDEAYKYIEDCFLKDNEIYDYIIKSGLFNKLASISNIKEYPISSIKDNQKIIIKDMRKIKSTNIPLNSIDEYYTELELIK